MAVSPRAPSSKRKPMAAPVSPRPSSPTPSKTHSKGSQEQLAPQPVHHPDADLVASSADAAGNGPADLSTSCHQCRQKTGNVSASCTNVNKRPCRIKMCFKCLLNRYGESAVEVEASGNWKCPKCRGICNCSICMKKKGQVPTGILAPMARSGGFSSVSELLQVQGSKSVTSESVGDTTDKGQVPMNRKTASENVRPDSISEAVEKKQKVGTNEVLALHQKKSKVCNGGENAISEAVEKKKKVGTNEVLALHQKNSKVCNGVENAVKTKSFEMDNMENGSLRVGIKPPGICAMQRHPLGPLNGTATANVEFPQGKPLMSVAGIEVSPEDVGLSLQFLEFCTTFMKFLDLHKGQAVSILRDLICSRGRLGRQSSSVQFQVKLLSILKHHNKADETQWLKTLQKCFSESKFARKDLPSDFCIGSAGYEKLSSSVKLKMLLFLCDEVLDTEALRIWIDNENEKFSQRHKVAKAKLLETKEKEKSLLKKLHEVAQPYGSSYPNSVQRKIANIKAEIDKARSEKRDASGGVDKSKQYSDAIRTRPLYADSKGRYFWSLNSCSANGLPMLIQEAKALDMKAPEENWFFYEDEEAVKAEKFISNFKKRAKVN